MNNRVEHGVDGIMELDNKVPQIQYWLQWYIAGALFAYSASLLAGGIPWTSMAFACGVGLLLTGQLRGKGAIPRPVFWCSILMVLTAYVTQGMRAWYFYHNEELNKLLNVPILFQLVLWGFFRWAGTDRGRFRFLFNCLYWLLAASTGWFVILASLPFLTPVSFFLFSDNVAGFATAPHLFSYHLSMAFPMFLILWRFDHAHKFRNFVLLMLTVLAALLLVERSTILGWGVVLVGMFVCGKWSFKYAMGLMTMLVIGIGIGMFSLQKRMNINENLTYGETNIIERFQGLDESDEMLLRYLLQKTALMVLTEHPFGLRGQQGDTWEDFVVRHSPEWWQGRIVAPHNGFLTMLADFGWIFLLPGILIIGSSLVWSWRILFSPAVSRLPDHERAILYAMPFMLLANYINTCFHNGSIFLDKFSAMFFFIYLSMVAVYWKEIQNKASDKMTIAERSENNA